MLALDELELDELELNEVELDELELTIDELEECVDLPLSPPQADNRVSTNQ